MWKKIKIIFLIILLIVIYSGYRTAKKGIALKNSIQSLSSFDYAEAKSNIESINSDFNENSNVISRENLEELQNTLNFIQSNYKNLSTISSKATEAISSKHMDNLISTVDSLLENNIDREYVSLDQEGMEVIKTIINLSNKLTSSIDKTKIDEFFKGEKFNNLFDYLKEKL